MKKINKEISQSISSEWSCIFCDVLCDGGEGCFSSCDDFDFYCFVDDN